jgi:hypothetical protein
VLLLAVWHRGQDPELPDAIARFRRDLLGSGWRLVREGYEVAGYLSAFSVTRGPLTLRVLCDRGWWEMGLHLSGHSKRHEGLAKPVDVFAPPAVWDAWLEGAPRWHPSSNPVPSDQADWDSQALAEQHAALKFLARALDTIAEEVQRRGQVAARTELSRLYDQWFAANRRGAAGPLPHGE